MLRVVRKINLVLSVSFLSLHWKFGLEYTINNERKDNQYRQICQTVNMQWKIAGQAKLNAIKTTNSSIYKKQENCNIDSVALNVVRFAEKQLHQWGNRLHILLKQENFQLIESNLLLLLGTGNLFYRVCMCIPNQQRTHLSWCDVQ